LLQKIGVVFGGKINWGEKQNEAELPSYPYMNMREVREQIMTKLPSDEYEKSEGAKEASSGGHS